MKFSAINFLVYFVTFSALSKEGRSSFVNELQEYAEDVFDMEESTRSSNRRQRVQALRELQHQHDELEAQHLEEKRALESKYQQLYQPLYVKRYEIVNEAEGSSTNTDRGLPDFWLLALKNNEIICDEITNQDEGALKYLKDIKCCRSEDPKGFKLDFYFDTNPYFKNNVLTKTYHMVDAEEPTLQRAIGTEIEWYPGKSLIQQPPKERSKDGKPITMTKECGSFFGFFNPPQPPQYVFIGGDVAKVLQFQMEEDYDIGATIQKMIIPHAVSWYDREAIDDDDDDSDEDDSYDMNDEDLNKDDDNEAAT